MEVETRRRVGTYICWECHKEFPLYEGQKRKYCPDCLIIRAQVAGKRGGRGHKKKTEHADLLARAYQIAAENQNAEDSLNR